MLPMTWARNNTIPVLHQGFISTPAVIGRRSVLLLTFNLVILESGEDSNMSGKNFLTHVAGLRAIAILLVVWFHISLCNPNLPEWATLPCGYFGVDIFLVIMGYFLIAGFVRRPDYPLKDFARGKAMRLLPPLAIMMILAFAACMWVMDYKEIRAIAKTGLGALLGYSNYQLMDSSAGYFAEDSTLNAYLHTWYLAVTIQVFVLSYGLYAVLRKRSRGTVILVICVIAGLSLLWNQAGNIRMALVAMGAPQFGPEEFVSYYDTLPRLWEIAAGGLVLLLPACQQRWKSFAATLFGLVLIIWPTLSGMTTVNLTPLVVLGTILVIRYMPESSLHHLLSNRAAQWLGGISFSVYLVHMPLLVFYRAYTMKAPDLGVSLVILALSIVAGYVFWWCVEKRRIPGRLAIGVWLAGVALCGVADATRGLQKIWNAEVNAIDIPKYTEWMPCYDKNVLAGLNTQCHRDEGGWHTMAAGKNRALDTPLLWLGPRKQPPTYVLLGDSHAQAFFAGFDQCSRQHNVTGVYFSSIMIPFWNREVLPITQQYYYNREKGESFMSWLRQQESIKTVVVAQYWTRIARLSLDWDKRPVPATLEQGAAALREFCLQVKACGKQLVLMGPLPDFQGAKVLNYARWLARKGLPLHAENPDYICQEASFRERFARETAVLQKLEAEGLCRVFYPAEGMFADGVCRAIDNGVIFYKDGNHITGVGSSGVLERLMPQMLPLLQGK